MIVVAGSRSLPDNKVIFAGTGLPMVAITLAQLTHGLGLSRFSKPAPWAELTAACPFPWGTPGLRTGLIICSA